MRKIWPILLALSYLFKRVKVGIPIKRYLSFAQGWAEQVADNPLLYAYQSIEKQVQRWVFYFLLGRALPHEWVLIHA